MAIEKPAYQVIKRVGTCELRSYAPNITATVEVDGKDYAQAATHGFRPLASYIFGENISTEEIAMTAPVTAQPKAESIAMTSPVTVTKGKGYRVSFFMPSKYTLETLPKPNNPQVQFTQNPAKKMACIRFSGGFNQRNFEKNLEKLHEWMQKEGLKQSGEAVIAGYDPPFTPWFLKHNEILIQVD